MVLLVGIKDIIKNGINNGVHNPFINRQRKEATLLCQLIVKIILNIILSFNITLVLYIFSKRNIQFLLNIEAVAFAIESWFNRMLQTKQDGLDVVNVTRRELCMQFDFYRSQIKYVII